MHVVLKEDALAAFVTYVLGDFECRVVDGDGLLLGAGVLFDDDYLGIMNHTIRTPSRER